MSAPKLAFDKTCGYGARQSVLYYPSAMCIILPAFPGWYRPALQCPRRAYLSCSFFRGEGENLGDTLSPRCGEMSLDVARYYALSRETILTE